MTYTVIWKRRAERSLAGQQRRVRDQILQAVDALANDPRPDGVRKMTGRYEGYWRIKVGRSYRVVYTIDDDAREVVVTSVGSREGAY